MKFDERVATYYIPPGETRDLRFLEDWWVDDNGTLLALVEVEQAKTDDPLLLKQFYASSLIRDLVHHEPDPDDWVRVTRHGDDESTTGWTVEFPEKVEDASDAM